MPAPQVTAMHAMVLSSPASVDSDPLEWREVPDPIPASREVRIRVEVCAVCRTDLHVVEGELPWRNRPVIPGHQVVGRVDRLGPGAKRFGIGDRIGIAWLRHTDGNCKYCQMGKENLCPAARFTGYDADGGYAEFATVPEDFAYALPTDADPVLIAPLLCAGIIGYHALVRAEMRPGCTLGLYGFGSSAHLAIQLARHQKCDVYVMTRDEKHQRLAMELGATWADGAMAKPPKPLDSAVLFAPAGEIVPAAMEALDAGGTLAIAGIHLSDIPSLNYERHLFHEKDLRSVTANTRAEGREFMELATQIPLRPSTVTFPLRDANEALRQLKHDGFQGSAVLIVS